MADQPIEKTAAKPVETIKPVEAVKPAETVKAAAAAPAKAKRAYTRRAVKPAPVKTKTVKHITRKPAKLAASRIVKGQTKMTETFKQVEETAKKIRADVESRTTAMFGDVSGRAKAAMEKGQESLKSVAEFQKGNLEAVVASSRIAAKGVEEIAKYSVEYGRTAIERANTNARRFAAIKSPAEFLQLQSELAKSTLDEVVAQGAKFTESYLKLLGDIAQPLSNRAAVAAEQVKKLAA